MENIETILLGLFDFHRFEKNDTLDNLIKETELRYTKSQLSEDDLEWVNAAGSLDLSKNRILVKGADDDDV